MDTVATEVRVLQRHWRGSGSPLLLVLALPPLAWRWRWRALPLRSAAQV